MKAKNSHYDLRKVGFIPITSGLPAVIVSAAKFRSNSQLRLRVENWLRFCTSWVDGLKPVGGN